jgi:hypothetical protein
MSSAIYYLNSLLTGQGNFISNYQNNLADRPYSRGISGQIVFQDDKLPDADMRIHVFAKDLLGVRHYLGKTKTDNHGNFNFNYNWSACYLEPSHRIVLAVVENKRPFASKGLFCAKNPVVIDKIEVTLSPSPNKNNVGVKQVTYANIPADLTKLNPPPKSQMQSLSYYWRFFKAVFPEVVKNIFVTLFQKWLSVANIQKVYDSFGNQYSKCSLTPDSLIDELLNKICAVEYLRQGKMFVWSAVWDGLELDQTDSLPNVDVEAELDDSNTLKLKQISIKFASDSQPSVIDFDASISEDKKKWALYVALSTFALKGEAEVHLAEGHILPGIPAATFFKYIKSSNPIFNLLAPHLGGLEFINWLGSKGIIFGKGSVLEVSALNEKSVAEVIIRAMSPKADFLKYIPTEPINDQHYHAIAENKFYNLLFKFFNSYTKKKWSEISEPTNWEMIYRWSASMNKHFSSFPLLTTKEKNPDQDDQLNLAKLMAWLVSKTTFIHWAAHSRQVLLTNSATLDMQNKALDKNKRLAPFGNTPGASYNKQLFIARTLLNFEGDALLSNPFKDMNPELLAFLRSNVKDFSGYSDISKTHVTTQI